MARRQSKTIKVTCEAAALVPLDEFEKFQGDLKRLDKAQYEALRESMIRDGFHTSIDVWKKKGERKPRKMLDGHQRVECLRRMIEEDGYTLAGEKLPVDWVIAATEKQAKRIILEKLSQYGRYNGKSVHEFMKDSKLDWKDVKSVADLPAISMSSFAESYFSKGGKKKQRVPAFKDQIELLEVAALKPHPRNYRLHSDDQVEHLIQSIKDYGFYRNVVATKDDTILVGHGVVKAAMKMGYDRVPGVRMDLDPESPEALKLLAADNETAHLSGQDDRVLGELLKEVREKLGLVGTGFTDQMLAAYIMVTRPKSEIENANEAAHWVGMPEFEGEDEPVRIIVMFRSKDDRKAFADAAKMQEQPNPDKRVWSVWWPENPRNDLSSVEWQDGEAS